MISYVTKRDGSVVEFDAEKLNQWSIWASNNCNIRWSEIVFGAVRKVYDKVSTMDIQRALIETCLEKRTEGHTKMAANLLIGVIYKEAFGDFSIPHLKDFYHEMVEDGWWIDMGYTDDELDFFDTIIDHTRDFTYSYATLKQFADKYGIKSFGRLLESPQMTFMGIAMANMVDGESRLEDVKIAYNKLSQLKINLPTPTVSLERTPSLPAPSCCVISGEDTVDSIGAASHIAYTMTAKSSGIGVELRTRSPKDPVKNGRIVHGGKYAYYSYLDRAVKSNKQAVRGGSATVTFHSLDPEVLELLTLKQQRTDPSYRLDHMDYSLAVNHLFLRKAAKNEPWMLVSPYFAKELWDLSYSGDQIAFEAEYDRVLKSGVKKTMINARDIVSAWVKARGDTGRVYITYLDNINSHTPFKDPVRLSNLCVAPETEILTDVGYVRIDEVENQKVNVWNGSEFSEVVVIKTGTNQQLVTVETDSGQSLSCTHYHKFYVFDGYGKPYIEKRAKDLRSGDKLMKFDLPIIEGTQSLNDAYANGFYSGDGCLTHTGQRIYLYGEKMDLKHLFSCKFNEGQDRLYGHYKTLKDKFFVPLNEYTIESRLEWFAGFLDADGCVYRNGTNEAFTASSINLPFLQDVQKMLQTLGVDSKIKKLADAGYKPLPANDGSGEMKDFFCQTSYRILISSGESQKLLDMGIKTHRLKMVKRNTQRDARRFIQVVDVVDEGRTDDTFCFNEPKRHLGMFNGILTGQCQEVLLPTKAYEDVKDLFGVSEGEVALCNLGSIVVSNIENDKDYEETAYILCKITDNTIEKGIYPFPQVEKTAKARRSIGIGMTDLAHLMARNDLKYDSEQGRNFIHALAEKHSFFLHKASIRLADERGRCEWFNKTKYADGWLPVDTYAAGVDEHHSEPLHMPWESLREGIKRGVRFNVLEAYMPTESSSLLTNSCNGVYPVRKTEIFKSSFKGSVYFRAPDFEIIDYQNAYEIDHLDMVKVYSIIQKFTGQGISADFYSIVDGDTSKLSLKSMLQRMLFAGKMGMKTFYYENFKTESGEEEQAEVDCDGCKL